MEAYGILLKPNLIETEISCQLACLIIASQKPVNTIWLRVYDFKMILIFQVDKKRCQEKDALHPMIHNKKRP